MGQAKDAGWPVEKDGRAAGKGRKVDEHFLRLVTQHKFRGR